MTFVNKNETRRYESVQGTPLPSSKVYDSAKKVSYFEQAFKIEAKIGSGCFGNVYRVKSKEDGKLYAVIILKLNDYFCFRESIVHQQFIWKIFEKSIHFHEYL